MWMIFVHIWFTGSIVSMLLGLIDAYTESKLGSKLDSLESGFVTIIGCSWVYVFCSYKRIYKNILILRRQNKNKLC